MTPARRVLSCLALAILLAACDGSRSEPEAAPSTSTTASTTTTTAVERVVYVYQQEVPVDALAASPLARRAVLLPVPSCGEVPEETLDALRKLGATAVRRIGGPEAICDDVMRQLEAAVRRDS